MAATLSELIKYGRVKVDDDTEERWGEYKAQQDPRGRVYLKLYSSNGKHKLHLLHRLICPHYKQVEHEDRDVTNNLRSNLRDSTQQQNLMNTSLRKDSTSGYKGVSLNKPTGKWRAQLTVNGRRIHLGLFSTKEEVAEAYNKRAMSEFKEFANLNVLVSQSSPTH